MYGTFRLACTNYLIHRRRKKKKKVGTQRVQKNNKRKRKKICVPESYAHSVRIFFFLSYVRSVCGILPTPELFDFVFDLFSNSLSPPLLCIYFSLTSFTVPPTPPPFFCCPPSLVNVITCDCRPLKDISLSMFCVRAVDEKERTVRVLR